MMPLIIFLLIITANFPIDIHTPAMPLMAREMHMSISLTQWTMSLFLLGYGICPIVFGVFSDAIGRKRVSLVALVILIAGCLLSVAAHTPALLLFSRFLQGIGASACIAIPRAIMRDCYHGVMMARMSSLIGIAVEFSLALSPVIGGMLVHHFGWRSVFIFILVLSLLSMAIMVFSYRETNKHLRPELLRFRALFSEVQEVLAHQQFIRYVFCSVTAFACAMAFFTVSPFVVQDGLHYTAREYGLITLFMTGALVVGAMANAIYIRRIGIDHMVMLGLLVMLLAGLILLIAHVVLPLSLLSYMIPAALAFFGMAFLFGNCSSGGLLHFPKSAGITGALYATIQTGGTFAVVSVVTLFPHQGDLVTALLLLLLPGLSLANFCRKVRPH